MAVRGREVVNKLRAVVPGDRIFRSQSLVSVSFYSSAPIRLAFSAVAVSDDWGQTNENEKLSLRL